MPEPLVAVVIPCYNRLALLKETIASVQAQTLDAWELIVADDGSTEPVSEYVESLADPRMRSLRLDHTGLPGVARNAGVKHSRAPYLAFLDSDDLWKPHKLERQLAAMQQANARWSYTGYDLIDHAGLALDAQAHAGFRAYPGDLVTGLLTTEASATIVAVMVTRELFEEVRGFDPSPARREDHDFVLKVALRARPILLPEPLVSVRHHVARRSGSAEDPFMRSVSVYERFLRRGRDGSVAPKYLAVARRMLARSYTSSAFHNARDGRPRIAAQRLLAGAWPGLLTARWWRAWLHVAAASVKRH